MRRTLMILAVFFIFVVSSGCGVKFRAYQKDVERVDQELPGYANFAKGGTSEIPDLNRKKTRKHIMFEFVKEPKEEVLSVPAEVSPVPPKSEEESSPRQSPASSRKTMLEPLETSEDISVPGDQGVVEEYTVQENDTLQKIAKKFYDSFSKWTVIYDANKDVLKDPNQVKPGMVLRIPPVQ